jgi:hypothetical protein
MIIIHLELHADRCQGIPESAVQEQQAQARGPTSPPAAAGGNTAAAAPSAQASGGDEPINLRKLVRVEAAQVVLDQEALVQPLEQALEQALEQLSAAIAWTFCVTTHNFSSCDKWYNNSRRCSSLSCSKSVPATLSWPS